MRPRPFAQVDVFTATPYRGNPLAVVLDGTGLTDDEMAHFAKWTHLSETTFVLPPTPEGAAAGADYRVRIFTPGGELPFAGHPTLGSCHAWLAHGGLPRTAGEVRQECAVGIVTLKEMDGRWAFAAPTLRRSTPDATTLAPVLRALGLHASQVRAAQHLDNGPHWLGLLVDSPDTVLGLTPQHAELERLGQKVGVAACSDTASETPVALIARRSREARAFAPHSGSGAAAVEPDLWVRAFAAPIGVAEDPVTGSLNASLAQWLMAEGHLPTRYLATQGQALGRDGQVHVQRDASGQVWVGGDAVTCIQGEVRL